jgi:hypothetical protein
MISQQSCKIFYKQPQSAPRARVQLASTVIAALKNKETVDHRVD